MRLRIWRRAAVILISSFALLTSQAAGHAAPHHHEQKHPAACSKQKNPLPCIAAQHHWNAYQQQDWKDVIHCESDGGCQDTSSVVHYNLTIENSGGCYGIAQFSGGASEYYSYGGNPYTVYGQLTAMANYIVDHGYGTPAVALQSEHSNHSY
jgi:hypothetical protein